MLFVHALIDDNSIAKSLPTTSIKKDKNEIQMSGYTLFHIYKNYVTTQDGNQCNFIPSCSSYCSQALHKHGPIKGTVMSFDRLARCHGLSPQKYEINLKYRKLIDAVQ